MSPSRWQRTQLSALGTTRSTLDGPQHGVGALAFTQQQILAEDQIARGEHPSDFGGANIVQINAAALDVFAYPSGYESFGIAFVEAWAAGKPVVGCLRGAVPSLVSDGADATPGTVDDVFLTETATQPEIGQPR